MGHHKLLQHMIAVALVALFLVGCSVPAPTATPLPSATPKPTVEPPPADIPLCNIDPLQESLAYKEPRTFDQRPPFYDGPKPLKYQHGYKTYASGIGQLIIADLFDEWTTVYAYADPFFENWGVATCAQALDKSGQLLAEARLAKIIKNTGIVILEVHYNRDRSVGFWSKSQINYGGFKMGESEAHGAKERDYFFIWPMSTH